MTTSPSMVELIKEHAQLARDLRRLQIIFDVEKCMGLWACYEVCPVDCWAPDTQRGVATLVHPEQCVACKACVLQCTARAIEFRSHRQPILLQLGANRVARWKIAEAIGWQVDWGPVQATSIPEYLDRDEKTDGRWSVELPQHDRGHFEMVMLGFYGLLIPIPIAIFSNAVIGLPKVYA